MTVLVTSDGRRLTSSGPFQLSPTGVPTLAQGSVPFSAWVAGGHVGLVGGSTVSYAQLYRTQPWVAVAVNKLTRQVSRLPLKVYRVNSQNDKERVVEHPLVDLLRKPWRGGSPADLKQALIFPALLHGNSTIAKTYTRTGSRVDSLLPLDWRFIAPRIHEHEPNAIMAWETSEFSDRRFIAPDNVVHTRWAAPDGPVGVSPLQQLGVTISLEDASQRYGTNTFRNQARMSGAWVIPKEYRPDKEERAELRSEIRATMQGIENANGVALMTGGAEWQNIDQTAKEAELIEQRKLNREEVAAVYDVPPPLIGILDKATYSNIETQHGMLYTDVLGPWLTLIEETIQAQLIDTEPGFEGLYVEFDLGEVLKGAMKERAEALKTQIESGFLTPNEARQIENRPKDPHPDASRLWMAQNNLSPIGTAPQAAGSDDPVVASLRRHAVTVAKKTGGGVEPKFNRERFVRELSEDVPDFDADGLADRVEAELQDAHTVDDVHAAFRRLEHQ